VHTTEVNRRGKLVWDKKISGHKHERGEGKNTRGKKEKTGIVVPERTKRGCIQVGEQLGEERKENQETKITRGGRGGRQIPREQQNGVLKFGSDLRDESTRNTNSKQAIKRGGVRE